MTVRSKTARRGLPQPARTNRASVVKKRTGRRRVNVPGLVTVALAAIVAVAPFPSSGVERWYSEGLYKFLQPYLTFGSNAVPFALLDVLIAVTVALFVLLTVLDFRRYGERGRLRSIGSTAVRLTLWSARLYLLFMAIWGFNYRRERMPERLPFDRAAITAPAATRLAAASVSRLNALHAQAHAEGWLTNGVIDPTLAGAFEQTISDLGATSRVVAGRPKSSMLDWYFQRAGVAGMTDPFFLETIVAGDVLSFERPLVVAHEWAHLAGLADEGEANLAGWLTCLRGSTAHQYSGWLFMYGEAIRAVPAGERGKLMAALAAGPREDLQAIRDRVARHLSPAVSTAGWRVYDSYLKANGVVAGGASYDEVVRLALGLRVVPRF